MKLTIIKNNFKKGLSIIERIAGKNFNLPILSNILLKTEKNFLSLSGTDLEVGINYWSLAKIEKDGEITVPAKLVSNLINFLPEEKIFLETKNNTLYVSGKNFKSQIKGISADDFPIIPKIKNKKDFIEIKGISFLKGLSKVINFCGSGQVHPELSGVFLNFQKGKLEMVSTDSFRLAKQELYYQNKLNKDLSFILPQKAVKEMINIISEKELKTDNNSNIRMYFESNQIFFEISSGSFSFPEFCLTSRLIEGDYPNYSEIIPKSCQTQVILEKKGFLDSIKAAAIFSGKINKIEVGAEPEQGLLKIFSQSAEIGEVDSVVEGTIKGEKTNVFFNHKFLIEGLSNFDDGKISFKLNKEEGPAALQSTEHLDYVYILMPIKG